MKTASVLTTACTAALLVFASPAIGADDPEIEARLDEARRELAEASRRVAELSQQLGRDVHEVVVERIRLARGEERPRLGLVLGAGSDDGVQVRAVTPDGPAADAGLRSGDVIESIDGFALSGTDARQRAGDARERLADLQDGQQIVFGIVRDGRPRQVTVEARSMPAAALFAGGMDAVIDASLRERLESLGDLRELGLVGPGMDMRIGSILPFAGCGDDAGDECRFPRVMEALRWRSLNLATVEPQLGRYFGVERGVLVVSGSDTLQGLEPGDVILDIDGVDIASPADAMRELSRHAPGSRIDVRIQRDGSSRQVQVTAPEGGRPGGRATRMLLRVPTAA